MNPQTAKASKIISAPAQEIYNLLADYRNGHPRVLPKEYFLSLNVEEGGFGEGTIVRFQMRLLGQTQSFRSLITEPEPGHVLVETDIQSGIRTIFLVDSAGDAHHARLTISTELKDRNAMESLVAKILLPVISKTSPPRHCEPHSGEAISQEIPYEKAVRDCFVGKNTLLAMTEKYFLRQVLEKVYRQELELVAQLAQNPALAQGSHRANSMRSVSST